MRYYIETVPFTCLTKRDLTVYLSKYVNDYFEDSNLQCLLSYDNKSVGYSNELQEQDHE